MRCNLFGPAVAGFLIVSAVPASAATYAITDIINSSAGGLTTSLFHEASSGGGTMGAILETAVQGTASGTYDSVSGAISVAFSLASGKTVTGTGSILFPDTDTSAIIGTITFDFSAAVDGALSHTIKFLDWDYGVGGSPNANGFNTSTLVMALWGASGTPSTLNNGKFKITDSYDAGLGADLRFQLAPIPVPAALPLYGTGLAVLGYLGWRRRRRAAA